MCAISYIIYVFNMYETYGNDWYNAIWNVTEAAYVPFGESAVGKDGKSCFGFCLICFSFVFR